MYKEDTKLDVMFERGTFEANGFKFTVHPVYLGEETEYLEEISYNLYPPSQEGKGEEETDEKELSRWAILLFRKNEFLGDSETEKISLIERFRIWIAKKFTKRYRYYADIPRVANLAKWIERKIYYKNKPVRFYDLERKYGLTKSEIVRMLGYFQELSGF